MSIAQIGFDLPLPNVMPVFGAFQKTANLAGPLNILTMTVINYDLDGVHLKILVEMYQMVKRVPRYNFELYVFNQPQTILAKIWTPPNKKQAMPI